MALFERPYFPIIYIRGFAGTQGEIDDTVADPYMGFNIGSTKCRQTWTGEIERLYFESPLIRLMKEHEYRDVYRDGAIAGMSGAKDSRHVFIFRYYEMDTRPIEEYAAKLDELIGRIKAEYCGTDAAARKAFRVYLVAHSMGGLICRCFLQNSGIGSEANKKAVDKVFTYATPHNGIDFRLVGNVPAFLSANGVNTFNRAEIRKYLDLGEVEDVSTLDGKFDPDRFFCMVGTNHKDYTVAMGLSRAATGPSGDGLVLIKNATTWGPFAGKDGRIAEKNSPRAFSYTSHSGHYGIVNSESGYQNLVRFLFGDLRVDGVLELEELTLPEAVQKKKDQGKAVRASYHIETVVRVRGARWELHRRKVDDESAIFRKWDHIFRPDAGAEARHPQLFSAFLSLAARVPGKKSLAFAVDLRVLVPEYQVENRLWIDNFFEGGYLFRDKLNLEAFPQEAGPGKPAWKLKYGLDSETPNRATEDAPFETLKGNKGVRFFIPLLSETTPGLKGRLVLTATPWE